MDSASRGAIELKTIFVKDFSEYPGPRFASLGTNSGEEFRDKVLAPAIKEHGAENVSVNLDGTFGYGSSFLDEAFGGLVRNGQVTVNEGRLLANNLVSDEDPSLIAEIKSYLLEESK